MRNGLSRAWQLRFTHYVLLFFTTWFLPLTLLLAILGLFGHKQRAGQIALLLAAVLLLLTGTAYTVGDVSWRLFPALVNGYQYVPDDSPPDARLVPRPPELFIERQLMVLIGQTGPAPLTLELVDAIDVDQFLEFDPAVESLYVVDIAVDGTLLLDLDLHQETPSAGNILLRYTQGQTEVLAETWFPTHAVFGPDNRQLVYMNTQPNHTPQLIWRMANGNEQPVTSVVWATHHWVDDVQIAYSLGESAYLYNLDSNESQFLVSLPRHEMLGKQQFRVSPDGQRIAYVDFAGRLWVKEMASGQQHLLAWDVTDMGWNTGLAWRNDGQQLLFTTRDIVTMPDQHELWLWDVASGEMQVLVRTGPGFLGHTGRETMELGTPCWVNSETVILAAYLPDRTGQLFLLVIRTDGHGQLWEITPEGGPFPYRMLHCANGQIAMSTTHKAVEVYQVNLPGRETSISINLIPATVLPAKRDP